MDTSTRIRVTINGEEREILPPQTVANLLAILSLPADRVAVELNRTLVRKRDWENTSVPDGSNIEIVEFVGGG